MSADDFSKYRELFVQEASELVRNLNNSLLALEQNPSDRDQLDSAFRAAHTLKGMAATMGYDQFSDVCKAVEELFDGTRKGERALTEEIATFLFGLFDTLEQMINDDKHTVDLNQILNSLQRLMNGTAEIENSVRNMLAADNATIGDQSANGLRAMPQTQTKTQTIRVRMDDLDSLVDLVGEIMIARMRLKKVLPLSNDDELRQLLRSFDRLINSLQNQTMKIRLVPIEQIFERFPRMIRDLCVEQGKEIKLEMEGTGIELDRTVLDGITDPLLHILRNAVDHAIETPSERLSAGKPRAGTIRLRAERSGDKVLIEVSDDGRGIELEKVKLRALEKHLISKQDAEKISEEDVIALLGHPGLSTTQTVTDMSGRGVGINVVISKIESFDGTVKIRTKRNVGTTFTLTLPMSLAIIGGLLVKVGSEKYIVPISTVIATVQVDPSEIRTVHDKPAMMFRNQIVSLANASELLKVHGDSGPSQMSADKLTVVIIDKAGKPLGLVVDSFESKQDIVLKHIDRIGYSSSAVPTDATILSDGRVALILDPAHLRET